MKKTIFKAALIKELPFFLSLPAILWQLIFFYLPIGFLIYLSVTQPHYFSYLYNWAYIKMICRSLVVALSTSLLSLICGYPIAYFLAFRAQKIKNFLLFFLLLPFWSSLLILVYAWFFILEKHGLINWVLLNMKIISEPLILLNHIGAVYVVMLYCYLPFMIIPIYTVLEKLDRKLLEASADLGASSLITTLRVTLPLTYSGMKTGFFLVFVPSFGEFVIPQLVGGGKQFFVGSLISHFFLTLHNSALGATFTILSCLILALAVSCMYILSKKAIRL
jgi:ABC-type spermidine/putrescine transport system permease subunit I